MVDRRDTLEDFKAHSFCRLIWNADVVDADGKFGPVTLRSP